MSTVIIQGQGSLRLKSDLQTWLSSCACNCQIVGKYGYYYCIVDLPTDILVANIETLLMVPDVVSVVYRDLNWKLKYASKLDAKESLRSL